MKRYRIKAVLVIDMPTECENCPCYDQEVGTCRASDTWKTNIRNNCPLKPLPEKLVPFGYLDVGNEDGLYEKGYNSCLEDILGGE